MEDWSISDRQNCKILNLMGTKVTDAGLEHLDGLKNLQLLHLSGTRVTDKGMTKLKDFYKSATAQRRANSRN